MKNFFIHRLHTRRSWQGRAAYCVLAVLVFSGIGGNTYAQSGSADEYEIRAAMLFNLTRFIEWPAAKVDASHGEFLFCILGSDPVGADLDMLLRNKTVGTKPVALRHLTSIDTAGACHVLYIGAGDRKSLPQAAASLERQGVLTVSRRSNVDSPGQMIGLPAVEEHVRIDVNLGLAQRGGFAISSKLLHLATVTQ